MPVIISHTSSLERLRAVPPQVDMATVPEEPLPMAAFVPTSGELDSLETGKIGLINAPRHIMVPSARSRPRRLGVVAHSSGIATIPSGLLREVGNGIYSAGPELAFIQMAGMVTPLGAVVLGYELCGSYSHFAPMVSGYYDRPPLTSVARIASAIDELDGTYGLSSARAALRWVRDGSASPMETVETCRMCLPRDIGAEGFALPKLYYEERLDAAARRMAGTRTCRIDIAWPDQHIGVEYDGKESHADPERDRRRREALAHMGWRIYVADIGHMRDPGQHERLVGLIGDEVPRHGRHDGRLGRSDLPLLQRLLSLTRFGAGMESVLFAPGVARGSCRLHLLG